MTDHTLTDRQERLLMALDGRDLRRCALMDIVAPGDTDATGAMRDLGALQNIGLVACCTHKNPPQLLYTLTHAGREWVAAHRAPEQAPETTTDVDGWLCAEEGGEHGE